MMKSMTGFGRAEITRDGRKITVEMKSVNHRYCEISVRMPKKLNCFDSYVRQIIKEFADRGKIDVFISYADENEEGANVKYNAQVAKEYAKYLKQMNEELGLGDEISAALIAKMPDVFTIEDSDEDPEELKELLADTMREACTHFVEARVTEGEHLRSDILGKLDGMESLIEGVEARYPEMMAEYRKKLTDKLAEVVSDTNVSEQTLAAELILYADKICVDEETVRLRAHIKNVKDTIVKGINVGRKLDFLAQEMNREANTILSKANDIEVSNIAIDIKTEIEKIREQIQNIE
jgi:uncharacterized protein (TIGR00255 family)